MIDISAPLAPGCTPTWPGAPPIRFEPRLRLADGAPADDTTLHLNLHTGTHVDAPSHFVPGGKSVDQVPLEHMVGPCWVAAIHGVEKITAVDLARAQIPKGTTRLLVKTDNTARWRPSFDESFIAFGVDAARWLVERGIRVVGIDYLSVQPFRESDDVHRVLLGADTVLLEGLRLDHVEPGAYVLVCLPLHLVGVEGAPARAVLFPEGAFARSTHAPGA